MMQKTISQNFLKIEAGRIENDLKVDLKLLNYLTSIYKEPKTLSDDKKIFHSLGIERDINFEFK